MIHASVTVNGPGVTSRTCAVTKVIRNKRVVRHIHVNMTEYEQRIITDLFSGRSQTSTAQTDIIRNTYLLSTIYCCVFVKKFWCKLPEDGDNVETCRN
jgi:hypothetical protein